MVDGIYRTRSLGVAASGIPDQYADGKAAKVWEAYIGCSQTRTDQYRKWICDLLRSNDCRHILDVACGHGVDSIMLLEEGFDVTSTDASDKMLKYALRQRWTRRKQPQFDKWVIEEGNWMTLPEDLEGHEDITSSGFDAVICLGNSFAHMPDFEGDQRNQMKAIQNFMSLLKPGGILLIDHRNYDEILTTGLVPAKNVYYNSTDIIGIKCSNLYVDGKPTLVTLDYYMDVRSIMNNNNIKLETPDTEHHFRLSYYPHRLQEFTSLLQKVCGNDMTNEVYADFKKLDEVDKPAYYIHLVRNRK